MVIRSIELTGKQPAAIEITRRDQFTDTRLQYICIGISEFRSFACGDHDYHSDLLRMDASTADLFIYMWRHLQPDTNIHSFSKVVFILE